MNKKEQYEKIRKLLTRANEILSQINFELDTKYKKYQIVDNS